jgi:hypothetical protein
LTAQPLISLTGQIQEERASYPLRVEALKCAKIFAIATILLNHGIRVQLKIGCPTFS